MTGASDNICRRHGALDATRLSGDGKEKLSAHELANVTYGMG